MINRIRNLYKKIYLKRLINRGLKVGINLQMEKGCNIDANFPWMIDIGDNVTMSSWVYLVCHDGAAQKHVGYSKIGKIKIGDNVFIGARSIVMPNVSIGDNCVIGANSVVTRSIPAGKVAVGSPAIVVMDIEKYTDKLRDQMSHSPIYESDYTIWGGITKEKMEQMKLETEEKGGFII